MSDFANSPIGFDRNLPQGRASGNVVDLPMRLTAADTDKISVATDIGEALTLELRAFKLLDGGTSDDAAGTDHALSAYQARDLAATLRDRLSFADLGIANVYPERLGEVAR